MSRSELIGWKREGSNMDAAIGYIRVSTTVQADDGISLEMQVKKIKEYCKLHEIELAGIYGDAISGKAIEIRPGFQAVMWMAERHRIQHVIVWKLDRLARKALDTLKIAEAWDKIGVALHSITDKIDTKSAIGRLFFTMQAALAEFERALIVERTQAAMNHLKATGQKTGSQAPYGYRHEGNRVVEDEKEQECLLVVQNLRELHPAWSLRKLGKALGARGFHNRNGNGFGAETIKGMLEARA